MRKYLFSAELRNHGRVVLVVVDLDAFLSATPTDEMFALNEHGDQILVHRSELSQFRVEEILGR